MKTKQERIIQKFKDLSLQVHEVSLLLNELSHSLEIQSRGKSFNEFKEILKNLKLDYSKLSNLITLKNVTLNNIKKGDLK